MAAVAAAAGGNATCDVGFRHRENTEYREVRGREPSGGSGGSGGGEVADDEGSQQLNLSDQLERGFYEPAG